MAKNLKFDCFYSDIWVHPDNWKSLTSQKSLKLNWYVECKFHDPLFKDKYPKGFPYRKKVNKLRTLEERKAAIQLLLNEIPKLFEDRGYNPITDTYMIPAEILDSNVLNPELPASEAIELAWTEILTSALQSKNKKTKSPFNDVRQGKNRFVKALKELKFDKIKIKELSTSQVKQVLVYMKLPDASYNKMLSYMSKIFTELIEFECVENNPFKLYKKRNTVTKIREILDDNDFEGIMEFLEEFHYEFFRYGMIFSPSGARSTELFLVQAKDVNIKNQEYKVLIKKGNQYVEEIKVIMLEALPYWIEIMSECKSPEDYLFSKGLKPGSVTIAARQISRRWNRLIKKKYSLINDTEVTSDFYALKHRFLSKLYERQMTGAKIGDFNHAQTLASHRTPNITNAVYLVEKKKMERDVLKTIKV